MNQEIAGKLNYWRWREYTWKSPEIDWHGARIITAGVDVGSVSSQAVILCDGALFAYSSIRTGSVSSDSAEKAMTAALKATGLELKDIHMVVGTGYGRVNVPFAHKTITEITCHAKGANYLCGSTVRTILDIGGQDCKAIRCNELGKVIEFVMNDKCAAGTGRGIEAIAELLRVPIEEVGPLSLSVNPEPPPVASTCVVFAKSEIVAMMHAGSSQAEVLAAYCGAMAHRAVNLLRRIGVEKELVITGGIAKNPGIVVRIERELGISALPLRPDPQIAGAAGAAVLAMDALKKSAAARA